MTKAVVIDDRGEVRSKSCLPTGHDLAGAARRAVDRALGALGETRASYVASTGFGRYQVPFRDVQITEITCHGRGAVALSPGIRSVLDIGAMNARAMRVDDSGRVRSFRMNDKCASGAGRFLERVAKGLEMTWATSARSRCGPRRPSRSPASAPSSPSRRSSTW
jgi:activator of 2-hydroxyglutaryl-CoA dehydratase